MDRFLAIIVGGNISPKTRETLLKELDEEIVIAPPPVRTEMARAVDDPNGPGEMMAADGGEVAGNTPDEMTRNLPGGAGGRNRRQPVRMEASITDPVTKMVGLILGSMEFQRQ